ncbi:MAG: hypothetical protein H6524_12795 [Actinobacteria bacterium]|jgi:uncharacterized membrane protein|nr:hypothetical protein [Micrococcales bacterium]MCB0904145.1 hypothetical protein [Actinomycetota bacterium]MCO5299847.1 hypothetical protein [Candidatus Nanopelagicales bacterium]MCB9429680.1 hypothetical protein [Actinomycetota bacterium]HPE13103.1 vitamin K epoxide reductase family protein [Actinomycetota bacterium]
MTTIHDRLPEPDVDVVPSVRRWGTLMLGASAVGIVSGSITVMDKIALLKDPTAGSFCDISSTVGCSPVLLAWQSSVLGPPNALLGVIMFAVLATAGAVVATGGRLVAGFHNAMLGLSVFFALFLTWYMYEVAYSVGSLCPFCTVCAAAVLTTMVGANRLVAAHGSGAVQRGAAGLAAGKWDVLIALGWGAIIAAMLFAGIWL